MERSHDVSFRIFNQKELKNKKEQSFKSYKGVKIAKCCEMVTVSHRAAARRRGRSRPTRSKVVATASYVFLEHCLGIFDSYHIKIKPVA